ncbi:MAG TPA: peptidoglycan editing factor PgeF [Hyphomicrobiaceae bacterium]|nr:peptidoglycan editing factor PgeF [Hyphomicrobiaceae bacterium]
MTEPIIAPSLASLPGIRHGFFGRKGGVSSGLYDSLNCGLGSRDARGSVLENRDRVARTLGSTGDRLLTCYQIHSADAVVVTTPWAPADQPRADALVTTTPGLVLGALAADCAPILFADPSARVVAAAHAGWKGARIGIVAATVAAMQRLGAVKSRIVAVVGPCISQTAYEVGPEFEAAFLADSAENTRYFMRPGPDTRPRFDLPGYVADRCRDAGLGHVTVLGDCTYADPDRFYSYRRTTHAREPDYGRQISAIMLTD